MSFNLFNKTLVIGILVLFIGTSITPSISSNYNNKQNNSSLTFYTFDKTGTKKCKVEISTNAANIISDTFEELKQKITNDSTSSETKTLKNNFVELLDSYDLIPQGLSKDYIVTLLNPRWKQQTENNIPLLRNLIIQKQLSHTGYAVFCSVAGTGRGLIFTPIIFPRPHLLTLWSSFSSAFSTAANLYTGHGFAASGSQTGIALGFWGVGLSFAYPGEPAFFGFGGYALLALVNADDIETYPPNQVPVISEEYPSEGSVNVPVDLSELSFKIEDGDGDRMSYSVTTVPNVGGGEGSGFDGVYSVPVSGLNSNTEYFWSVFVSDGEDNSEETFSFRTQIEPPFVSDPIPVDGDDWVSVDLSKLSFRLEDYQGDNMEYTVETAPDIGSSNGSGFDGVYSVDISGLDYTTEYSWFVNVTDGKYWTRRIFSFKTQPIMIFDPFDEGWQYRKKITIDHNMVTGDLSSFPVLVSLVDSDLADRAQFDGDDILFMDGDGIANRLLHEIEKYDGSVGELVAWVNVSNLSSSVDSVFYLYYGNSGCSSQEYPFRVWDSDFIHVWHLGDSLEDSAGSDDGNDHGTDVVSGKIGMARDFEENEKDFIDFGDMDQPADGLLTTITWECWVKPETKDVVLMTKYDTQGPDYNSYHIAFEDGGKFRNVAIQEFGGVNTQSITNNGYSVIDKWIYLTSTFTLGGINDIVPFINGDEVADTQISSDGNVMRDISVSDDLGRFRPEAGTRYTDGIFDEVRWSKVVRSDDWIKTSFNTMNDPLSFFSIGPEESGP